MSEPHATFEVVWPSVRLVAQSAGSKFYFEPTIHPQCSTPIILSFDDLFCHAELDNQLWPKHQ